MPYFSAAQMYAQFLHEITFVAENFCHAYEVAWLKVDQNPVDLDVLLVKSSLKIVQKETKMFK